MISCIIYIVCPQNTAIEDAQIIIQLIFIVHRMFAQKGD
jgi:hypothetical protein